MRIPRAKSFGQMPLNGVLTTFFSLASNLIKDAIYSNGPRMNLRIRVVNQYHLPSLLGEQDHGTIAILRRKGSVRKSLPPIIVL